MSNDIAAKSAPSDRESSGPYDESEANPVRPYIDLGGVKVLPREGLNLRLEVEEQNKRIVAVGLDYADSTLQIQPFAAPRSSGLWDETRAQIEQQVRDQGGSVTEQTGALGLELVAELPTANGEKRTARFVGVDGPRWFLRGVIGGAAATDDIAAAQVEDLFRSIVVVRGNTPMPPRDLIPLKMPAAPRSLVSDSNATGPDVPRTDPAGDASREDGESGQHSLDPPPSEVVGRALSAAVRRAGIDPDADQSTGSVVWSMIGGVRGVVESVLPGLAFLLIYTLAHDLLLALAVSVGLAALFTVIRLVQRSTPSAAIGGLVATGAAAGIALLTGRAEDNFVLGLITNAAWGTAFLVSALIGWSLIGLAAGFLTDEGVQWRKDPRKRRVYFWLAIAWAGLFYARLATQFPFYLSGDVAVLGTVKLIMGIPLFAVLVAVTWFAVRAVTRTSDE